MIESLQSISVDYAPLITWITCDGFLKSLCAIALMRKAALNFKTCNFLFTLDRIACYNISNLEILSG